MKKILSVILAAMLLMLSMTAALAGQGDQALLTLSSDDGYSMNSLQNVFLDGNKVYMLLSGADYSLQIYDLETGTSQTWDMQELTDRMRGFSVSDALNEDEDETAENVDTAENSGSWTEDAQCWFAKDGELYALVVRYLYQEGGNQVDGGHVRKLTLADGKASLAAEDTWTLDWSDMTETAGNWTSSRYISSSAVSGDTLYTASYDNNGNMSLQIFDLTTGAMEERVIQDMNEFGVGTDGSLLISQYSWGDESWQIISIYDPDSESLETLARFSMDDSSIGLFTYQPETDTIYFLRGGEIYAAPGRDIENAQAVNDCPSSGKLFAPMLPDGRILVWSYDFAMLRNTDPALRSETILRIRPFSYSRGLENTIFAFTSEHSDIAVVREDWGNETTLLQSMMNRDGAVDVYLISLESSAFSAILDRGFAADLSTDAKIMETVENMYPFVKETLSRNGKLMAIPLSINGDAMGYNPQTLEKMGMTAEELPKTWDQYLDFLEALPQRLEGTNFRPFDFYTYRDDMQSTMLRQILNQYILQREDAAFNTEELRNLLDRVQKINFEALGVMSDDEINQADEEGRYSELGGDKESLLNTYAEVSGGASEYNYPLVLSLREGEEPMLPVSMTVAFVNPYSEHQAEAILFLESLLEHLDTETKYSLNPDLNEPVRYPGYEEWKKYLEKLLKQAQDNLEKAEDDLTQEQWEERVQGFQDSLAEYSETNWMIGPKTLALYRERAQYLRPLTWNFFTQIYNMEGGEQFSQLQNGFNVGTTPSAELLSFIDKKVQMMRLEGN